MAFELDSPQAKVVTKGIAVVREKQHGIATQIFPDRLNAGALVYKYPTILDAKMRRATEARPGTAATKGDYKVSETTVTARALRMEGEVDDWERKWDAIDKVATLTELLTDKILREQEIDLVDTLNAGCTSDNGNYTDVNADGTTNDWDDNINGNPIADILLARRTIQGLSYIRPSEISAFLIDEQIEAALLGRPDIQRLLRSADQGAQLNNGRLERLFGMDVRVMPFDEQGFLDPDAETQRVMQDDSTHTSAFVGQPGTVAGFAHVAEALFTDTWEVKGFRMGRISVAKTFKAHMQRPLRWYQLYDPVVPS